MRRILAWMVWVLLAGAVLAPSPVLAQQQERDQQQKAVAFVRLWEQLQQTQDPAELVAWSEEAIKLEGELDPWPLPVARDEARVRLWRWSGLGYTQWMGGEREEKLERAIAAYERAAQIFTRETVPNEWARTQDALGEVYRRRIRGERAENLDKAIAAYEEALTVMTREAFPPDWALAQASLGLAYLDRLRGDRGENLEKAIAAYEAALTVRTREALPQDWAWTQHHLARPTRTASRATGPKIWRRRSGSTRRRSRCERARPFRKTGRQPGTTSASSIGRILGDRADNLEKAIEHLEAALSRSYSRGTAQRMGRFQAKPRTGVPLANKRRTGGQYRECDCRLRGGPLRSERTFLPPRLGRPAIVTCDPLLLPHPWTARGECGEGDRPSPCRAEGRDPRRAIRSSGRWLSSVWGLPTPDALSARQGGEPGSRHRAHRGRADGDDARDRPPALGRGQDGAWECASEPGRRRSGRGDGAYEAALTVFTREEFPLEWSMLRATSAGRTSTRRAESGKPSWRKPSVIFEAALAIQTREDPAARALVHLARSWGGPLGEGRVAPGRRRVCGRARDVPAAVRPRAGRHGRRRADRRCRAAVRRGGLCRRTAWRDGESADARERGSGAADVRRPEAADAGPAGRQAAAARRVARRYSCRGTHR